MSVANLASLAGTGAAPARSAAAGPPPSASSAPTSAAASGTRTSPPRRAAVIPSGGRRVANRKGALKTAPGELVGAGVTLQGPAGGPRARGDPAAYRARQVK